MVDATAPTPILCASPGCGQVLAKRHPSGDTRPLVVGCYADPTGRLIVTCPACQRVQVLSGEQKGGAVV